MKSELPDSEAWESLIETLKGKELAKNFECKNQFLDLLRKTLEDPPDSSLGPRDKLVRLRQALRFGSITLHNESLPIPKIGGWPDPEEYSYFNMIVKSKSVSARPWKPEWIDNGKEVDKTVSGFEIVYGEGHCCSHKEC